MLWSLLFILLIGAPKCLEGACSCPKGELTCSAGEDSQMCQDGACRCSDDTPICPDHGACTCSDGQPTCPGGKLKCPEEFPFNLTEPDWNILSQSSNQGDDNAKNAVDGKKGTCTNKISWWMIDLKDVYNISYIAIYNTGNEKISGAQIYIGNCPDLNNRLVKNITDFQMNCWNVYHTNTLGRYITVSHPVKNNLKLCEVRINAKKEEPPTCPEDFPFNSSNSWITSQSSNFENHNASRAIDGNKTVCAHTNEEENSWWMVDLQGVYYISSIAIYNRCHHNSDMTGARIHIGYHNNGTDNKLVKNITDFQMDCWNVYHTNTLGRYITVSIPEEKHLVLCEVRINAKKEDSPFVLIKQKKTWANALEYCRANHMDLASILDEEEQALAELEVKKANTNFVWLGLHYTCVLEFWFWVADYPLCFDHWAPDYKKEECDISVAMQTTEDHRWFSKCVYEEFNFLCEK